MSKHCIVALVTCIAQAHAHHVNPHSLHYCNYYKCLMCLYPVCVARTYLVCLYVFKHLRFCMCSQQCYQLSVCTT